MIDPPGGPDEPAESVLRRWNPAGADRLRRLRGAESAPGTLAAIGPAGVGIDALRTALAASGDIPDPIDPPDTAAVVLVVLDAGTPIDAALLTALAAAADTGDRFVLAMNKVDAHAGWRAVLDRNAALLAEHLPALAGAAVHPVSARTGTGVDDLAAALRQALDAAPATTPQRRRRARDEAIALAQDRIVAQLAGVRSAADIAELRAERARLLARREHARVDALSRLRSLVQLARVDLVHQVGTRVRTVSTELRDELDRAGRTELRDYPQRVRDRVAGADAAIGALVAERIAELGRQVLGEPFAPPPAAPPGVTVTGPAARRRGLEDKLVVAVGASAGASLGRLAVSPLSLVPALDMAMVPATLLLGGGAAWWLTRSRGRLADRAHLRQWTTDALVDVKAQLDQRVAAALVAAEAAAGERSIRREPDGTDRTDRRIAEIDDEVRRASAGAAGRLAACERDLAVLDRWRAADPDPPAAEPIGAGLRPTQQSPTQQGPTQQSPTRPGRPRPAARPEEQQ